MGIKILARFDIPDISKYQNFGSIGMFKNSIFPVNKLELVPPRVNCPLGSSASSAVVDDARPSQKDISGLLNWPFVASVCQNGVDCVVAILVKARPIIPDTEPDTGACCIASTATKFSFLSRLA